VKWVNEPPSSIKIGEWSNKPPYSSKFPGDVFLLHEAKYILHWQKESVKKRKPLERQRGGRNQLQRVKWVILCVFLLHEAKYDPFHSLKLISSSSLPLERLPFLHAFFLPESNENKIRNHTKSTVVGKAKIMTSEDIALAKRKRGFSSA
jgi:hypothetical protein